MLFCRFFLGCLVSADEALGDAGRQLWADIHAAREVPKHLSPLVLNVCRIQDRLNSVVDELEHAGLTMTLVNKNGDETGVVANPLLVELRMQSATFSQLMARLGLDKLKESASGKPSIADELRKAREAREAKGA